MKSKLFRWTVVVGCALCTFLATVTSASACAWGTYQPEEPKLLREE
ncbi:cyclic lactone autoinducer peptide [Anaeromicrobium sediminis]|uniref:Cyclic lactone autoinducer peptide n=1 Tax=Anaeromicrobium sediminis TaxID=1478221 RepID=A0A267MF89_9FIRM|nr:cyclic lactone autoinducer peptide [Anaeromicrobium sediminis]PAB58229.1 hypothetical protein CCE28_16460 [Anaeromicrobium sediminis]